MFNELQKIAYNNERDEEYPAFTCFNEDKTVDKHMARGALPVIYSLKVTSLQQNHEIAVGLKDAILKKKLKLLTSDLEAKEMLIDKADFLKKDPMEQARLLRPYLQTTSLINEMINLEYSLVNGHVKLTEKGTARKDRYSSLAYSCYLASLLEKDELKKKKMGNDEVFAIW